MKIILLILLSLLLSANETYTSGSLDTSFEKLCNTQQPIVVAVTSVDMSNRSAKLVFDEDGIQDLVTLALKQSHCFKVIDWQHLSDVIEQQQLKWSDIQNDKVARGKLRQHLSVDYFLDTDIYDYALDTAYATSTFSKEKEQSVTVGVAMKIKNAMTNEIVETVSNNGFAKKTVEHSLGFGANTNNSNRLNNDALREAIQKNISLFSQTKLAKLETPKVQKDQFANQIDVDNISNSLKKLVKISSKNECPGKWVTTSGYATFEKGHYQAKKRSLMDAYRDAVSIGSGLKISSKSELTMTESMTKAFSFISKSSKGFISHYEILSQGLVQKNLFETKIKACVNTIDSAQESKYLGLQQYVTMMGNPTLLIVLDEEQTINVDKSNALNTHTIEIAMGEYFQALGYKVILSDDLLGREIATEEQVLKARTGSSGYAVEIARSADADFLIVGNLKYDIKEKKISDTSGKLISLTFNAKAIFPGSGRTAKLYSEQDSTMKLLDLGIVDQEKMLKKNAIKMANKISWEMPTYLLEEERDIELKLIDVKYKTYKSIVKSLKKEKTILEIEEASRWKRTKNKLGTIRLLVKTSYLGVTSDDLLELIESYNFSPDIDYIGQYNTAFIIGR